MNAATTLLALIAVLVLAVSPDAQALVLAFFDFLGALADGVNAAADTMSNRSVTR